MYTQRDSDMYMQSDSRESDMYTQRNLREPDMYALTCAAQRYVVYVVIVYLMFV